MKKRIYRYDSETIEVSFDLARCIHAQECIRGLPAVFDRDRRPWIDASADSADAVARVIERCPSGALTYVRKDGGTPEVPSDNLVEVSPNGPLYVRGDIEIADADDNVLLECTRVALCRCGASANKPLCDGSHERIGFADSGQLGTGGVKDVDPTADGRLRVKVRAGASLRFTGNFTVCGAGGTDERRGTNAALCRCGASMNKPFCDSSHKELGDWEG